MIEFEQAAEALTDADPTEELPIRSAAAGDMTGSGTGPAASTSGAGKIYDRHTASR